MKGFYITVKNGLLDPKHVHAMGGDRNCGTIWLFLWLLDKMTIINYETGEGQVLGGKPITHSEIKQDLGVSLSTYKRYLVMLRKGGYISTIKTSRGLKITIYKAFKVFNQKIKKESDSSLASQHAGPLMSHQAKKRWRTDEPSLYKMTDTVVDDNTVKTIAPTSGAESEVIPDLLKDKKKHIQIIGYFALAKSVKFESVKHQRTFIKRHTRAAAELVCYDIEKIKNVMRWLFKNTTIKWTLETVGKYIDEDLNRLRADKNKIIICQ